MIWPKDSETEKGVKDSDNESVSLTTSSLIDGDMLRFLDTTSWSTRDVASVSRPSSTFRRRLATRKKTIMTKMMMTAMVRRHNQTRDTMSTTLVPDDGAFALFPNAPDGPAGPGGPRSPFGPVLPVDPTGPVAPVWPVAPCVGESSGMVDCGQGTQSLVSFRWSPLTVSTYASTEKSKGKCSLSKFASEPI